MKKLIILDFTRGETHIYTVKTLEDYENLIEKLGHNIDNCQWMIVDNDLQIILH